MKYIFNFLLILISFQGLCQNIKDRRPTIFSDTGLTSSEYITYIESAIQKLTIVRNSSKISFKVQAIKRDVPDIDSTINIMKECLKYGEHLDIRDLQMFRIIINDVHQNCAHYKEEVDTANVKLSNAADKIKEMSKDSIWKELRRDTSAKRVFNAQLKDLRKKWRTTDSTLRANIIFQDELTIKLANNSIVTADLLDQIENRINKLSRQIFAKEQHYIWEKKDQEISRKDFNISAQKYYQAEKEVISYYLRDSIGLRLLMILVGILFYIWVNKNFKNFLLFRNEEYLREINIKYLSKNPYVITLIVVLSLSPFFDLSPPAVYINFMQFLLMMVLTWIIYKHFPKEVMFRWFTILFFYLFLSSIHLISSSSIWLRYLFLVFTFASIAFGITFLIHQIKNKALPGYIKWVTILYIFFNVLASVCNIFGRWTLAHLFGSSAVFGLSQIIGLSIFIQICVEAFTLNLQNARIINGLSPDFDFKPFVRNIKNAFTYVAIILWIMVLASNLNIYNFLFDRIVGILSAERKIGSITFNVGSVFLFFIIIWVSSTLQKYISYLFGDTGEEISKVNKKQHSKLLLIRLVLLTVGFFLAVAASGLPVDKITIIIGALGVGIGLGLQNIVNNFVSGVILIFERPFQVGDSIEIGIRKGKVKEIGIRHSILLTPDGAEVIVPNGDMLSNQITNWTLSNDYIRLEIPLKLGAQTDWNLVNSIIKDIVKRDERVLPGRDPVMVINTINTELIDFKIQVWCKDFYKSEILKSDLVSQIYMEFKSNNIDVK